jgi:hypothetical protein
MGSRHGHAGAGFVLLLFASARVVMVFSAQVLALFEQLSFMPIREAAPCINRTAAWRFAELSFQGCYRTYLMINELNSRWTLPSAPNRVSRSER